MKKKILYGVAVFVLAAIAAWNVNISTQNSGLSDVSLANVEALAVEINNTGDWEVTIHSPKSWTCKRGGGSCCPDFYTESC